jgi:integrase
MPLRIVRRKNRGGALTISGSLKLSDGSSIRIERRASTDNVKLAEEQAAVLEAQILRTSWHGAPKGDRLLITAIKSFGEATPRSDGVKRRLHRILLWMVDANETDIRLRGVNQDFVNRLAFGMLRPNPSPATVQREVITPISTVVRHAAGQGWCDPIRLTTPTRSPERRTNYLTPEEAERLLEAAAPHLKPLLLFLIGTGARLSEALELEWRDVDLEGARVILWRTKSGKRRNVVLPPRVVAALSDLPRPVENVFLTHNGLPYSDAERRHGGQIKTGFKNALRRAGLPRTLRVHDLRHTWASWHYVLNTDPLRLMVDGGWTSLRMVERYAHLMKVGFEDAIRAFYTRPIRDRRSHELGGTPITPTF